MLSYECSNVHSNRPVGMVEKINFYHGITDVLQIDHSQMPMKKLNLVEDVVHAAEKSTTAKQFFMSMRKIKEKTAKKVITC